MTRFNPLDHPICFEYPSRLETSAWTTHIPLGMYLVDVIKPRLFVELGTHTGVSYCAFCQAVDRLNLNTTCHAVDTWVGDEHSGFYGPEVLADLRAFHDPRYSRFSTLIQSTFDEALDHFGEDSIDLLHLDGYHTYEVIKHDLESWLPKMSDRGVVLIHDIEVRERNFGAWKVWAEATAKFPSFAVTHGHGLGILGVGEKQPSELKDLYKASEDFSQAFNTFFYQLGYRILDRFEADRKAEAIESQLASTVDEKNELDKRMSVASSEIERLNESLQTELKNSETLKTALETRMLEAREYQAKLASLDQGKAQAESRIEELLGQIELDRVQLGIKNTLEFANRELEHSVERLEGELEGIKKTLAERENSHAFQLRELNLQLKETQDQLSYWLGRWTELENSIGWWFLNQYRRIRFWVSPVGSRREKIYLAIAASIRRLLVRTRVATPQTSESLDSDTFSPPSSGSLLSDPSRNVPALIASTIQEYHALEATNAHSDAVDIIVCVHNALDAVRICLSSILRSTHPPYNLILVDDGSDSETASYLREFSDTQRAKLLRNDTAFGYTFAANQGLKASSSRYVVLLNSDTQVTYRWLDKLIACADSDPSIGMVGPLSNTASWQSVPELFSEDGDWARNPIPGSSSVDSMAELIGRFAGRVYPFLSFLNGYCMLIKREVIEDIGYFDERTFGEGYGEENDYSLRLQQQGWKIAIADDAYVFHAQSQSYSHARRAELTERSNKILATKHSQHIINLGANQCRKDRVMQGVRARARVLEERQSLVTDGLERWEGRRVLYLLPIQEPGGGGHVVIQEAHAMRKMGVDVRLVNFKGARPAFELNHPDLQIPVEYIDAIPELGLIARNSDAVIATVYHTVDWLRQIPVDLYDIKRGYYIQDFEPFFFEPESIEFQIAMASYGQFKDLIHFTKTEWTRDIVAKNTGIDPGIVGPSVDIDLFRPRHRLLQNLDPEKVRIAAMIRPSTPRRNAAFTIKVLDEIFSRFPNQIEILIFGSNVDDPQLLQLEPNPAWNYFGILNRKQLSALFDESDVFIDLSRYQAMGLSALEAMACGTCVLLPRTGGTSSIVQHEQTGLLVDTTSKDACEESIASLIQDRELREMLTQRALFDVVHHFPERAAYQTLNLLLNAG